MLKAGWALFTGGLTQSNWSLLQQQLSKQWSNCCAVSAHLLLTYTQCQPKATSSVITSHEPYPCQVPAEAKTD